MGGTPDTCVIPDSDSSCSESATADTPAGGKASPPPHEASLTGEGIGGGRFAAGTVAVRSYPRVRSSPHLPYVFYDHNEHSQLIEIWEIRGNGSQTMRIYNARPLIATVHSKYFNSLQ